MSWKNIGLIIISVLLLISILGLFLIPKINIFDPWLKVISKEEPVLIRKTTATPFIINGICQDNSCFDTNRLPLDPLYPMPDELEVTPVEIKENNVKVIVPRGYEPYGEKMLYDLKYCYSLVPTFIGIKPYWGGATIKIFINQFGKSGGGYNDQWGVILYGQSQEDIDIYLNDIIKNNQGGFLYQSSPTYCANTHEFTHFVVMNSPIPSWANEGIAEYSQKFNQPSSKDDTECSKEGYYSGDPWETGDIRRFFNYSDFSENCYESSIPGACPKYYRSGMCFWELFDQEFGESKRREVFTKLRTQYSGRLEHESSSLYYFVLDTGEQISLRPPETVTSFFIEEILFDVLAEKDLKQLLFKFGLEESIDYNIPV